MIVVSKEFRKPQRVAIPFYQDEYLKARVHADGLDVIVNGGPLGSAIPNPVIPIPTARVQPKAGVQSELVLPQGKVQSISSFAPMPAPEPIAINFAKKAPAIQSAFQVAPMGINPFIAPTTSLTTSACLPLLQVQATKLPVPRMDATFVEPVPQIPSRQTSSGSQYVGTMTKSPPPKSSSESHEDASITDKESPDNTQMTVDKAKTSPLLPSEQPSSPKPSAEDIEKAQKAHKEIAAIKTSMETELLDELYDCELDPIIPVYVREFKADDILGRRFFRRWVKETRRNTASKMRVDHQLSFTFEVPPAPSSFAARWKHLLSPTPDKESSPWEGLSGSAIDYAAMLSVPSVKSHLPDQDLYWKVAVVSSLEGRLPDSIFEHIAGPGDAISSNTRISSVSLESSPSKLHLSTVLWQDGIFSQLAGTNAVVFVIKKASNQDEDRKWFSLLMSSLNPTVPITLFILSCVRGYDDVSVSVHLNLETYGTACISNCFIWSPMADNIPSSSEFSHTFDQYVQQMLFCHVLSHATSLSPPVKLAAIVDYELNRHLEGAAASSTPAIVDAINAGIHSVVVALERSALTNIWPPKELFNTEGNCSTAVGILRRCLLPPFTLDSKEETGHIQQCLKYSLEVANRLASQQQPHTD